MIGYRSLSYAFHGFLCWPWNSPARWQQRFLVQIKNHHGRDALSKYIPAYWCKLSLLMGKAIKIMWILISLWVSYLELRAAWKIQLFSVVAKPISVHQNAKYKYFRFVFPIFLYFLPILQKTHTTRFPDLIIPTMPISVLDQLTAVYRQTSLNSLRLFPVP